MLLLLCSHQLWMATLRGAMCCGEEPEQRRRLPLAPPSAAGPARLRGAWAAWLAPLVPSFQQCRGSCEQAGQARQALASTSSLKSRDTRTCAHYELLERENLSLRDLLQQQPPHYACFIFAVESSLQAASLCTLPAPLDKQQHY